MSQQTPLYEQHQHLGAKLVDFAGWDMPLHYTSQIQEHHAVRQSAGMFDVSHMGVLDICGAQASEFLRYLLANDVAKLVPGKALYTCMLNPEGGVIDDLIVYQTGEQAYRIVLNAGRCDVDYAWFEAQAVEFEVELARPADMCIIAVQGPEALAKVTQVLGDAWQGINELKLFNSMSIGLIQVARTGYTGEEGVEIILPADAAVDLWQELLAVGVVPCGLGARDTLRLEAGLNLYGSDMTEQTSPFVSNLAWTVSFKDEAREFIGRVALEQQQAAGIKQQLVGIIMTDKGVLRDHQDIISNGDVIGEITSGSFSPSLGHAVALARINTSELKQACIERRGKTIAVKIIKPPFVRNGKSVYTEE